MGRLTGLVSRIIDAVELKCTKLVLFSFAHAERFEGTLETGTSTMIRLGKLTDYGLVLMTCMARDHDRSLHTATDLAAESRLPRPTVSKLLKELLQGGLLVSHRGISGGYSLARAPREISVAEIITVLEGPIALTECSTDVSGLCDLEPCCPIKNNQRVISQAVRGALGNVMLSDLIQPLQLTMIRGARGNLVPTIDFVSGRMQ